MVKRLVESLLILPEVKQILLTLNVPESLDLPIDQRIQLICNSEIKGFGANHNSAFRLCSQEFFCPLNPDISLVTSPFPMLLETLNETGAAIIAPRVISPVGKEEDSVRRFPTIRSLSSKFFGGVDGRYDLDREGGVLFPEWVAGMFMLFRREAFSSLRGFDEGFFLYYEDVDICVRAWKTDFCVAVCLGAEVIHDARRDSHRSLRHLLWHFTSLLRYFGKHWGRLPKVSQKLSGKSI